MLGGDFGGANPCQRAPGRLAGQQLHSSRIVALLLSPIIVQVSLTIGGAIIDAAGLSFLGLGVQPPTPEWGTLLSAGRNYIRDYSYLTLFPGLVIMITVIAFNMLGDGLRDAMDPKLKN